MPNVHLCHHPVMQHLLTELRDQQTGTDRFRALVRRISMFLAMDATCDLHTQPRSIQTPMEKHAGVSLKGPITVVPILRAGLGMAPGVLEICPDAQVGHLGMFRDEKSLNPVSYYENLPSNISAGPLLLVDPMLATGGSALSALTVLTDRGCTDIRALFIIAAPEGIERLTTTYPEVKLYVGAIDRELNDLGFILPGLGDAGDRQFGTAMQ